MTRRYLYAIVARAPSGPLGLGLAGEPLSLLSGGDVLGVVGEMQEPPTATSQGVRGHDAVVRRLAEISEAILPARFGAVQDQSALADWLASASGGLAEALRLVSGREQMTLHVFDDAAPVSAPGGTTAESVDDASLGPGARYLAGRRRHWRRQASVPELEPLRPRLDALIAAERVEHRATPPFRASVYHLIERGRSTAYREAVELNLDLVAGVRLRVSGPWAPYAFVPDGPSAIEIA